MPPACKKNKGFTLIEVVIVIAIIGILAAIAIPNFLAYRNKAYCSSAEVDAKNIAAVISDYFSEFPRTTLPTSIGFKEYRPDPDVANYVLADSNIGSVTGDTDGIRIVITDVSRRCPKGHTFQVSMPVSSGDGWRH